MHARYAEQYATQHIPPHSILGTSPVPPRRVRRRSLCFGLFPHTALLAGMILLSAAKVTAAPSDTDCLQCHEDKTLASTNAAGQIKSLFVDTALLRSSSHRTNTCAACHADVTDKHPDDGKKPGKVNCSTCHERQSKTYGASVHGLALKEGDAATATCQDCHDSHQVLPPSAPESPLHYKNLSRTCGKCHDKEARDYAASVHGTSLARGDREAPTCISCHSEHKIEKLKGATSKKISEEICSQCHASERINTKFRLPTDRVQTFFESYHGLASQYGSARAANCASCHGYHLVLPSNDPRSMINTNNLVTTCGECHPGASRNFALGKIHLNGNASAAGDAGALLNLWVKRIYIVLIVGTIGFMLAHNGLLWWKKFIHLLHRTPRTVVRMDRSQRWQHFILLFTFILLAWTGFALKFPESWVARSLGSNEEFRRWTHRLAGVTMILLGFYHIWYVAMTAQGRKLVKDFLPLKQDALDLLKNLKYLVGRESAHAKIGRFGYAEKMEYWAVIWGTIIMGVTGLMLWFAVELTRWAPRWVVDVATTIHYYEAILACLAIVVWHFYHVIFDPDVYPINPACLDGRVSQEWMDHEHPLDTTAGAAESGTKAAPAKPAQA